jgi:hypothetical protein
LIADCTVVIMPPLPYAKSRTGDSGGDAMIIVQHSAQTFAALHRARVREMNCVRLNQSVVQTLMVPLAVIMSHEVLNGCPQRTFPKEDQPFQAGLLDAAHEALRMRVGMSPQMRRIATLKVDVSE